VTRGSDRLAQRLAARLDELSDDELGALLEQGLEVKAARGDGGARHCLAVFRGGRRGASEPIDDTALLAEIDALVLAGRGTAAVAIVARKYGKTPAAVSAIERRLRRKRAAIKNGQRVMSAPASG
jgi:hypothetical protein